jgi:hypothetical protein
LKVALIIFALIFSSSSSSFAVTDVKMREMLTSLYGQSEIYEAFYFKLREALISGDKKTVAELNDYPIRVNFDSGSVYYKSANEFIKNYSDIVTNEMLSRVSKHKFKELFANSYGMHIGLGDIWFTGYCIGKVEGKECDKVKVNVTTYNVNHIGEK